MEPGWIAAYPNGDVYGELPAYRALVDDFLEVTRRAAAASELADWFARRCPGANAERTAWNERVRRLDLLRDEAYSAIEEFSGCSSAANTASTPGGPK